MEINGQLMEIRVKEKENTIYNNFLGILSETTIKSNIVVIILLILFLHNS